MGLIIISIVMFMEIKKLQEQIKLNIFFYKTMVINTLIQYIMLIGSKFIKREFILKNILIKLYHKTFFQKYEYYNKSRQALFVNDI